MTVQNVIHLLTLDNIINAVILCAMLLAIHALLRIKKRLPQLLLAVVVLLGAYTYQHPETVIPFVQRMVSAPAAADKKMAITPTVVPATPTVRPTVVHVVPTAQPTVAPRVVPTARPTSVPVVPTAQPRQSGSQTAVESASDPSVGLYIIGTLLLAISIFLVVLKSRRSRRPQRVQERKAAPWSEVCPQCGQSGKLAVYRYRKGFLHLSGQLCADCAGRFQATHLDRAS